VTMELATELDSDELRPGTSLLGGRLVIDQRIGRGGMSTVYAATDRGQSVAVKIIASVYASDPTVCQRFRNEARLGQALAGHTRVVVPYEVGEAPELDGRLYMTMPLVKGTPLSMVSDRHAWRRWVAVTADLARTVADLHEHGIVHRDIKPGNVILAHDPAGRDVPFLLDFGSAYSEGDGHVPATAGLTRSDECPGTKFYMAPEQALGHPAAPSFDVYALALSLYELVLGMHPLEGMTSAEAVRRKCNRDLPSLSLRDHRPELPEALLDAVDRALERDPEQRTPTAGALADQLDAVRSATREPIALVASGVPRTNATEVRADGDDGAETESLPPDLAPRPRTAKSAWMGLAAAILLAFVGVGVWLAVRAEPAHDVAVVPPSPDRDELLAAVPDPEPAASASTSAAVAEPVGVVTASDGGEAESGAEAGDTTSGADVDGPVRSVDPERKRKRKRKPTAPSPYRDPSSDECVAAIRAAERAATRHEWDAVLKATAHSTCWGHEGPWRALRVQAFFGLGKYRACVKAAGNATDPSTRRTAQLCRAALPTEGSTSP